MVSEQPAGLNHGKSSVFLVDDHPLVREGFAKLIGFEPDLQVCGQAESASDALRALAELTPDVIVVDIGLKGTNGIELIKQIRALHPQFKLLTLSAHDESLYAVRALRAGANGYVMKQAPTREVLGAIRKVARGGRYLSRLMEERLLENLSGSSSNSGLVPPSASLSDRELEVFQLIGDGVGTREIAEQLRLSMKTIETHRAHIKQKLQLRNGTELIRVAVEMASQAERGEVAPPLPDRPLSGRGIPQTPPPAADCGHPKE